MSSSKNGSFLGGFFTFLFMVFLVWMVCSPKKEPFFELTIDDYKVELFGKRFVKVENIENSEGTVYDSLNSIIVTVTDSAARKDLVNIISIVSGDSATEDSIGKPIVPTPGNDYEIIEEFEYPDKNEFEF